MTGGGRRIRELIPGDWPAVRAIYAEGIATRMATFQTEVPDWEAWDRGHHPFARLVAEEAGTVLGWAGLSPVSARPCYRGVAEVSIYLAAAARGQGIGKQLLQALINASADNGIWTLQSSTFVENLPSLSLQQACGFRIVGRRERIAQLDGAWRDVFLLERRDPNL